MPRAPLRPPASEPLAGSNGQVTPAWMAYFQDLADVTGALARSPSYANDAAAKIGGVGIGGVYRNGSVVQIRVV